MRFKIKNNVSFSPAPPPPVRLGYLICSLISPYQATNYSNPFFWPPWRPSNMIQDMCENITKLNVFLLFVFPLFICNSIIYCLLADFSERVFRGVQHFGCQFQDPPKWPEMVRKSPKMAPRWPPNGPPDGPQMAPKWPPNGPRWPKMAQDGPQMAPKWLMMESVPVWLGTAQAGYA